MSHPYLFPTAFPAPSPGQLCWTRTKVFPLGTLDICQPTVPPLLQFATSGSAEQKSTWQKPPVNLAKVLSLLPFSEKQSRSEVKLGASGAEGLLADCAGGQAGRLGWVMHCLGDTPHGAVGVPSCATQVCPTVYAVLLPPPFSVSTFHFLERIRSQHWWWRSWPWQWWHWWCYHLFEAAYCNGKSSCCGDWLEFKS